MENSGVKAKEEGKRVHRKTEKNIDFKRTDRAE